jgi:hypothetical protein
LAFILTDNRKFSQKDQCDNEQVKIVSFQTSAQNLNDTCLAHLLFNIGILAYVEQDVQRDEKEFVLLPDENVELFQLRLCCDLIFLIVFSPHFDVFAVEQVEPLNLILQHINDSLSNLLFGDVFLKLSIVREDVEYTEQVNAEIDVPLMILREGTTEDLKQWLWN